MMYAQAKEQMMADMGLREVSDAEIFRILEGIGRLGSSLTHLPYCELRRTNEHRFGCLRLWPKFKNFGEEDLEWSAVKWRPLASFRQHKWRRLFSLVSQF